MTHRRFFFYLPSLALLFAFVFGVASASETAKTGTVTTAPLVQPLDILANAKSREIGPGPVGADPHGVPFPRRLILGFAANASGDTFYNDPAPSVWQNMLGLAAQYWNASPNCPGGVSMLTMKPGTGNVSAKADQGGCRMWISTTVLSRAFPRERCIIVVHEWGHLLGKGHTSGIMAADASIYDQKVGVCDSLATVVNGAPVKGFYPLPLSMGKAKSLTRGLFLSSFKIRSCKRVNYYRIKCRLTNSKKQVRRSTVSRYSNGYKLAKK